MTRETLYFDEISDFELASPGRWIAQRRDGLTWAVFSPTSEEIGFIEEDRSRETYFVTCESLGIRRVQRQTVETCVRKIASALHRQQQLQP